MRRGRWGRRWRLTSHPRAAAGWCCLCWSPPQPSSSSSLLVSWGLVVVQHGQAGPTQLAPERFRELRSDWSSPTLDFWLAGANLDSNWQKRALGLSVRLLTHHLSHSEMKMQPQFLKKLISFILNRHFCIQRSWTLNGGSLLITEPFVCSILRSVELGGSWGLLDSRDSPGLELGPRDNSRREAIEARHWPNQICQAPRWFWTQESGSIQISSVEPIRWRYVLAPYEI